MFLSFVIFLVVWLFVEFLFHLHRRVEMAWYGNRYRGEIALAHDLAQKGDIMMMLTALCEASQCFAFSGLSGFRDEASKCVAVSMEENKHTSISFQASFADIHVLESIGSQVSGTYSDETCVQVFQRSVNQARLS